MTIKICPKCGSEIRYGVCTGTMDCPLNPYYLWNKNEKVEIRLRSDIAEYEKRVRAEGWSHMLMEILAEEANLTKEK